MMIKFQVNTAFQLDYFAFFLEVFINIESYTSKKQGNASPKKLIFSLPSAKTILNSGKEKDKI